MSKPCKNSSKKKNHGVWEGLHQWTPPSHIFRLPFLYLQNLFSHWILREVKAWDASTIVDSTHKNRQGVNWAFENCVCVCVCNFNYWSGNVKCAQHCNCRKFRTWFNFVYFVLFPKTRKSTELVAFEYQARISVYVTLSWLCESL